MAHTGVPPKKKAKMTKSKAKTVLVVVSDTKSVVHKEFLPSGQTVNAAFYVDDLER